MPANVPADKVLLEKTPNYFRTQQSVYLISRMNASVILVLRHPVRRLLSDLSMTARVGVPPKKLVKFVFNSSGAVNSAAEVVLTGLRFEPCITLGIMIVPNHFFLVLAQLWLEYELSSHLISDTFAPIFLYVVGWKKKMLKSGKLHG